MGTLITRVSPLPNLYPFLPFLVAFCCFFHLLTWPFRLTGVYFSATCLVWGGANTFFCPWRSRPAGLLFLGTKVSHIPFNKNFLILNEIHKANFREACGGLHKLEGLELDKVLLLFFVIQIWERRLLHLANDDSLRRFRERVHLSGLIGVSHHRGLLFRSNASNNRIPICLFPVVRVLNYAFYFTTRYTRQWREKHWSGERTWWLFHDSWSQPDISF